MPERCREKYCDVYAGYEDDRVKLGSFPQTNVVVIRCRTIKRLTLKRRKNFEKRPCHLSFLQEI